MSMRFELGQQRLERRGIAMPDQFLTRIRRQRLGLGRRYGTTAS